MDGTLEEFKNGRLKDFIDNALNEYNKNKSIKQIKRKIKMKKIIKWLLRKALCIGSAMGIVFVMFGPSILGVIAVLIIDATVSTEIKVWFKVEEKCSRN